MFAICRFTQGELKNEYMTNSDNKLYKVYTHYDKVKKERKSKKKKLLKEQNKISYILCITNRIYNDIASH